MLSDGFDRHFARINLCKTCSGNRPVGKLESSIGMEGCSNLVKLAWSKFNIYLESYLWPPDKSIDCSFSFVLFSAYSRDE